MSNNYLRRTKFFVSTKADLLTEQVNKWYDEMDEKYGNKFGINTNAKPIMSYTTINDKGAYMIGCCINYILYIN